MNGPDGSRQVPTTELAKFMVIRGVRSRPDPRFQTLGAQADAGEPGKRFVPSKRQQTTAGAPVIINNMSLDGGSVEFGDIAGQKAAEVVPKRTHPLERFITTNGYEDQLARLKDELVDDPSFTLASLTTEEQRKVSFRVLAVEHSARFSFEIAKKMGTVDYYVGETKLVRPEDDQDVIPDRLKYDLMVNTTARHIPLSEAVTDPVSGEVTNKPLREVRPAPEIRDYTWSPQFREPPGIGPIIRTMDVTDVDPIAIEEHPELLDEYPPPRPSVFTVADADKIKTGLFDKITAGFYRDNNDQLRGNLRKYITVRSLLDRVREQRQIDDLSVIAANAVRRHPEKEHIEIGVFQGALHSNVLDTLLDGTKATGTLTFVPERLKAEHEDPSKDFDINSPIRRQVLTGEEPNDASIDRMLFLQYCYAFTDLLYSKEHELTVNDVLPTNIQKYVTDEEIAEFLAKADEAKHTEIPSEEIEDREDYAADKIFGLLMNVPAVRGTLNAIDTHLGIER